MTPELTLQTCIYCGAEIQWDDSPDPECKPYCDVKPEPEGGSGGE